MPLPRKWITLLSFIIAATLIGLFAPIPTITWQGVLGTSLSPATPHLNNVDATSPHHNKSQVPFDKDNPMNSTTVNHPFQAGTVKPVGEPYTKTLVLPRTKTETTEWVDENFGSDNYIDSKIYVVDGEDTLLHPPKNKVHEVMVYLTYIIDYYHNLSDVNIFIHSHQFAWHNNELLELNAVQMIQRLSSERVQREGYMNLRCNWDPGCPGWIHPGSIEDDVNKQEQPTLAKSWSELFPLDSIPSLLAQPCCGQFAVSGDRIRSLPLSRYVSLREWLLSTNKSDYISGRVFEYVWQFIFTGKNVVCPKEHICYCDGFGICFGGEGEFDNYYEKVKERIRMEQELAEWEEASAKWTDESRDIEQIEKARGAELQTLIEENLAWCEKAKEEAQDRGDIGMYRAKEVGREWKEGDGF